MIHIVDPEIQVTITDYAWSYNSKADANASSCSNACMNGLHYNMLCLALVKAVAPYNIVGKFGTVNV